MLFLRRYEINLNKMENKNKVLLMILDGWGIGKGGPEDAIAAANTPNMDRLSTEGAFAKLGAAGEDVGLPDGQMGNSEVGHLNMGAGRIVYQDLVRINNAIKDGSFFEHPELLKAFNYAKEKDKQVHLMGLVSDGGVHSMNTHLYALCDMTDRLGLEKVYVHAFTDGRDTDPKSGIGYLMELQERLQNSNAELATICGRYYAMDRDKRWERIKAAYDMLVKGEGHLTDDIKVSVEKSYMGGVTDEFIEPIVDDDRHGHPRAVIEEGDVVLCFNYRSDRMRQLTTVLTQQDMPEQEMKTIPLYYLTMTNYDDSFENVHVIFDKDNLQQTLGEVVSAAGMKQLRIAETEKYAHVTFFFSGGREEPFEGETRRMIPSPKVATYDLKPEMSVYEVKDTLIEEMDQGGHNLVVLNIANGDMVGHTGVFDAAVAACEAVDKCVGELVEAATRNGYSILITADHGNIEYEIKDEREKK